MDSDDLTEVAYTNDQAEAGMIRGLLESGGIPSILKGMGIDGPRLGFGTLATSPQRVMVRASQAEQARALLANALIENEQDAMPDSVNAGSLEDASGRKPRSYGLVGGYARIYLWSFGIMAVTFGIFLLLHSV